MHNYSCESLRLSMEAGLSWTEGCGSFELNNTVGTILFCNDVAFWGAGFTVIRAFFMRPTDAIGGWKVEDEEGAFRFDQSYA